MPDDRLAAGLLLVLGPILGLMPVAYPPLVPIWTAPRAVHIATVGAHRRAWAMLNAGFGIATILTACGLALLPVVVAAPETRPLFDGAAVAYAMGGVLWLAVLAIRTRMTPLLADDAGAGDLADSERLVGAATGGLFAAFTVITAATLIALGLGVAVSGGTPVATGAGGVAAVIAAIALVSQLRTGDSIPAVLYVPTVVVGVAVLAGWI